MKQTKLCFEMTGGGLHGAVKTDKTEWGLRLKVRNLGVQTFAFDRRKFVGGSL